MNAILVEGNFDVDALENILGPGFVVNLYMSNEVDCLAVVDGRKSPFPCRSCAGLDVGPCVGCTIDAIDEVNGVVSVKVLTSKHELINAAQRVRS